MSGIRGGGDAAGGGRPALAPPLRERPSRARLAGLARGSPHLELRGLRVGYGSVEVVHELDLMLGRGQSLCLVGPNGAGKSTLLHGMFGLADVLGGQVLVAQRDLTHAPAQRLLLEAKVAYVLQASSVFPDMTVEENLFMGGYLLPGRSRAKQAVERILDAHPRLAERRRELAGALSGGERRMLELSRALMTEPDILLVDEPSVGLEPRGIDALFEMLRRLQRSEGKSIVIVEQNVRKGLEFADLGYVLVAGRLALADTAPALLQNPRLGRLFLGG